MTKDHQGAKSAVGRSFVCMETAKDIRINPDAFTRAGVRLDPSFKERVQVVESKLGEVLKGLCDFREMVDVHHLFYDD